MAFRDKAPAMQDFLNGMAQAQFGRTITEALKAGICVDCGKRALPCLTTANLNEYHISALCSSCQDKAFSDGDS